MRTTLLAFSCLFVITSFAQDGSFQIKDYKYRTPGFRALTFSTDLAGSLRHRKIGGVDSSRDNSIHLYPTSLDYSRFVSTDRKFAWSNFSLASSYSYSYRTKDYKRKSSYGSGGVSWNFDNRYFRKNNWFWQLGNKVLVKGSFDKESLSSLKSHQSGVTDALTLGFGKGRIEMVQDAQMALYILRDLKAEGLIDHEVDSAVIYQFARLVTNINNKRVFDSRRKRIYELTQIDSFLRNNGIPAVTDIRYFTIINDNWSFAFNPYRSSGSDWFFHVVPSAEHSLDKWDWDSSYGYNHKQRDYKLMPEFGIDSHRPLSLQWQRNLQSTVSWARNKYHYDFTNYTTGTPSETKTTQQFDETHLDFIYGIGYYPNTRTSITSSFALAASYFNYKDGYAKNEIVVRPSFGFNADYFLSYRTRLTANFYADYQYDHIKRVTGELTNLHDLNINFGVSLLHAFL